MTRLGELAAVVETGRIDSSPEFCVTGTVSYVVVYQEQYCHVLVDGDGVGVDIMGSFASSSVPVPGDRVRFDGTIMPRGAGSVQPDFAQLEILGHGEPPPAAEGSAAEIMGGRHDFRRAVLVGEVRDVEPSGTNPNWNFLSLIADGRQYYAPVPTRGASTAQLEALIGAMVKLDGFPDSNNCSFRFLDERRFMVAGRDNIEILAPPPDDPFEKTPPVSALQRLAPETLSRLGRHKANGRLVAVWQSRNALLRMPDGRTALVSFTKPTDLARGQSVEIIGYPSTDGFFLRLARAIGRAALGEPFAEPKVLMLSEADVANHLSGDSPNKMVLQGRRLQLCGTVADFGEAQRGDGTFALRIAGHLLEIDFSSAPKAARDLATGCRVRVTGTCVLATENWGALSGCRQLFEGIRLVVDRADDLAILAYPPWWTPARLGIVLAVLLFALAAILVWNRELRILSEKRGRELFRERSAGALAELKTAERTRLAVEIHDSISQVLTGAALQLDAGEVSAAKRILASCRRELRCCIWDLRSHALDTESFADAVRETIAPHLGTAKAVIDIDIPSSRLSESLRHAALRIIREATVNAVRHGRAATVTISGEFADGRFAVAVVDDGQGFDPLCAKGTAAGHFGLQGMRERAKAFNGSVAVASQPGGGAEVSAVLEEPPIRTDESDSDRKAGGQ